MSHRLMSLIRIFLVVLLVALLGVVTEYVTRDSGSQAGAWVLLGVTVLALFVGTAWQHLADHPVRNPVGASVERPYLGLEAFTEHDTAVFFGRETDSSALFDRLHPHLPERAHRFVAVIGPSGAGKSSLVQAGLLARLARSRWAIVPALVPGQQPIQNLARSLAVELPGASPDTLVTELEAGPGALLRQVERLRAAHGGRPKSVLLVIDQAEELVTLTGRQECLDFLGLLRTALRHDPRLWVVATLRSEFLTGMLEAGAADLFRDPLVIGPLSREALFEVIEKPAAQANLTFAPGVVTKLVDDAGSGDALPLLAYTLQALYLRVGPGGTVTAEDYRQLGGVTGTLARRADQIVTELHAGDAGSPVLATLLKFVTLEGNEPTRRRVHSSTLTGAERAVVDAFLSARLLTSDAEGDVAVIQVAHEALFRQWAPLRQAIEAAAEDLRQRAELERWAQDWERSGRRDSYLLRDERLRIAQQWAANSDGLAEFPLIREFLELSRCSDHAAMERLSEAVAKRALAAIESDPEQGILLALAAVEECAATPLAHRALLAALATSRVRGILRGHQDMVWSVAWSPDGRRLATASGDGTARIWDLASGAELTVLRGHEDWVRAVAWSPDGRCIATTSDDATARVWDAGSGAELVVLRGHQNAVRGIAWSPDGGRLATGSGDATARVWDAGSGAELVVLRGHQNAVRGIAWSPDGGRLATGSRDATARIWDAGSGAELAVLRGHQDAVRGVGWSPDGCRLVTGSKDRTARIWDVSHGTESAVLRGHQDAICGVGWSPAGRQLATCSYDRTTRIWNVDNGTELVVLRGHQNTVLEVNWSPDGRHLATCSYDRTTRIWNVDNGTELVMLSEHQDMIRGVAWSPDGRHLATASLDRTTRIWNVDNGTERVVLSEHQDMIWGVAWSPDGRRVVTASGDHSARICSIGNGTEPVVLRGHTSTVRDVAWSPDGRQVATGSDDHSARIWNIDNGTEIATLDSHQDSVRCVAWSPDSRRLATVSDDRTVRIWNAIHGTELAVLYGHEDWAVGVTWSPDGHHIVTCSLDRTARIWDVDSGTQLTVLHGHHDAIWGVAWSPDGKRLATASLDGTARIWDVDSGTQLAVIHGHHDAVRGVAWSPDGTRLATGSDDRTARIWSVAQLWDMATDLDTLITQARTRVFRELTHDERSSVMLPHRPD